jgi:phage terminase small subunit
VTTKKSKAAPRTKARKKVQRKAAKVSAKRTRRAVVFEKAPKTNTSGLTAKQQTFVAEYLANGFNATQAAISAGYSAKTADSQACRLLKLPAVAAAVEEGKRERLEDLEITGARVLKEIGKVAFADRPFMLLNEVGGSGFEVKLKDKIRALELLGKNQKLFTEKVEHSGSVAIAWVTQLSDEELEAQLKARGVKA